MRSMNRTASASSLFLAIDSLESDLAAERSGRSTSHLAVECEPGPQQAQASSVSGWLVAASTMHRFCLVEFKDHPSREQFVEGLLALVRACPTTPIEPERDLPIASSSSMKDECRALFSWLCSKQGQSAPDGGDRSADKSSTDSEPEYDEEGKLRPSPPPPGEECLACAGKGHQQQPPLGMRHRSTRV